jgi:hypothetical protein
MNMPITSIRADLGSLSDDGLVQASRRYVTMAWYPLEVGLTVLVMDPDGPTCNGLITRIDGMAIDIEPIWATYSAGPHVEITPNPRVAERERTQAAL